MREMTWKAAAAVLAACFGVAVTAQAQELEPTHPQGTHTDAVIEAEGEIDVEAEADEFDQQEEVLIIVPETEVQARPAADRAEGQMDVTVQPGTVDAAQALPTTQPATMPTTQPLEQRLIEAEFDQAQPAGEEIEPLRDKPIEQQLDAVRSEGVIDTTPQMDTGDREMQLERDVRLQREGQLPAEDYPATPPIDQQERGLQEVPADVYDEQVDVDVPADTDPNVELGRDLVPSAETPEANEQRRLGVLEKERVNEAVPAADTQDIDEALQNLEDRQELDAEPTTQPVQEE